MANVFSIGRLMGIKKIIDVNPVTVVEDSDIQINLWLPLDTSAKRTAVDSVRNLSGQIYGSRPY